MTEGFDFATVFEVLVIFVASVLFLHWVLLIFVNVWPILYHCARICALIMCCVALVLGLSETTESEFTTVFSMLTSTNFFKGSTLRGMTTPTPKCGSELNMPMVMAEMIHHVICTVTYYKENAITTIKI